MSMFRVLCIACMVIMSHTALASVKVDINGQQYRYSEPVRLAQVLAPVAMTQDWYWPASRFYDLSVDVEEQRAEVIALIDALTVELEPKDERAIGLRSLRQQVEGWKLAKRVKVPVNYDVARLDISANPQLQAGTYKLSLTTRPNIVHISGLVKMPGTYEYQSMASGFQYTQAVALRADAEPDFVYVISPDGELRRLDTAYWNRDFASIMPGSQLIVPVFSYLLTPSLSELNQRVAELAVNRVFQ